MSPHISEKTQRIRIETGGYDHSITTDYLNEVIYRAKRADKSLEQCIQDFYRYNKDFNKEQEAYIRAHWNNIA